jgi:hypothetical protein
VAVPNLCTQAIISPLRVLTTVEDGINADGFTLDPVVDRVRESLGQKAVVLFEVDWLDAAE